MSDIYCIDTSSLIWSWKDYYPATSFPTFWEKLDVLIAQRRLRSPMTVYEEIQKKSDDGLAVWCKVRKQSLFVDLDEDTMFATSQIVNRFPRLTQPVKGRGIADGFVVATAHRHGWMVVTQELSAPKAEHIPDVCQALGIDHIRIVDLIAREAWVFR